jgi:hypothetical protein
MRWEEHVAHMEWSIYECEISVRKHERKKLVQKPNIKWEDNINTDIIRCVIQACVRRVWFLMGA